MKTINATLAGAALSCLLVACGGGASPGDPDVLLQPHPSAINAGPLAALAVVSPRRAAAVRTPDASSFFNWAESAYPALFEAPQSNQNIDVWTYRYYPKTDIYLGTNTSGDVLGLVGKGGGVYDSVALGKIADFGCSVYPSDCVDTQSPTVTAMTAQAVSGNTVTLNAIASDNVGVTGYCFKTVNVNPLASDACFQTTSQKSGVALTAGASNFVWAKDAAGNVSASLAGPCSSTGYAASGASTKNAVCMMTDKGELVLELDATRAPMTVANFLQYVNAGFYGNTVFHRIISTFMVQGGGFTFSSAAGYTQKATNAPIVLENSTVSGLHNVKASIAMARTSVANSATSQFFINTVDNLFLDGTTATNGYAVFGKVVSGLDVLDQIKAVPVQSNGSEVSQPVSPLFIQWAYQLK